MSHASALPAAFILQLVVTSFVLVSHYFFIKRHAFRDEHKQETILHLYAQLENRLIVEQGRSRTNYLKNEFLEGI